MEEQQEEEAPLKQVLLLFQNAQAVESLENHTKHVLTVAFTNNQSHPVNFILVLLN